MGWFSLGLPYPVIQYHSLYILSFNSSRVAAFFPQVHTGGTRIQPAAAVVSYRAAIVVWLTSVIWHPTFCSFFFVFLPSVPDSI